MIQHLGPMELRFPFPMNPCWLVPEVNKVRLTTSPTPMVVLARFDGSCATVWETIPVPVAVQVPLDLMNDPLEKTGRNILF